MDWLILILGVPAVLVPLVLLVGFAGCAPLALGCDDDTDCPAGTRCDDGVCVVAGVANPPPPSAPVNLTARGVDDRSVTLTWTNTEPAATGFRIERDEDGGNPQPIFDVEDPSATGTTDTVELQEGVTYIYQVRALVGAQASEPSNISSATVLPAAPENLTATVVSLNQIDLAWDNASTVATVFIVERSVDGGLVVEIGRVTAAAGEAGITFPDSAPTFDEGTQCDYRVFAIIDGFQNNNPEVVRSAVATASATIAFRVAFTLPPGTFTTDQTGQEGLCIVQRLNQTLLLAGGTQLRMRVRGSTALSLTLDSLTISQPAATGDEYDSAPDLTDVIASPLTIPANTVVTVGPVTYTLDPTQDLLIAFDISNNNGNPRFGPLIGCDVFAIDPGAEAGVPDRSPGYAVARGNIYLIETIEVL